MPLDSFHHPNTEALIDVIDVLAFMPSSLLWLSSSLAFGPIRIGNFILHAHVFTLFQVSDLVCTRVNSCHQ